MKLTKAKKPVEEYPSDVNLLHLQFLLARNNRLLMEFLNNVMFIREHPNLTEEQTRRELTVQEMITVPKTS